MSERPLVSVCIPTYRGAEYLAQAIDSVLAQTLTDFELVIVDDQSPDDTEAIVARYTDPRIRYLRNPVNLGPEGNWNRCLSEARGTYFKLLPHDDLLHPDCLTRQVEVLEADHTSRISLVFCARDIIGPDGRMLMQRGYPGGRTGSISGALIARKCIRRGTNLIGEPGAVLVRRTLAERVGLFDATNPYVIDLDYWLRLLAHGDGYYLKASLATFRMSRGQWTVTIGRAQSADFNSLIQRIAGSIVPGITPLDISTSRMTSWLNRWLRRAFYRIYLD